MAIQFTNNSDQVRKAFSKQIQNALTGIGMTAERYAKENCPVDTGRLRGSITYATRTKHSTGEDPATTEDTTPKGTPENDSVYVGTNVEYAEKIETMDMTHTVGRAHFLRDAATQHSREYENIAKSALKS